MLRLFIIAALLSAFVATAPASAGVVQAPSVKISDSRAILAEDPPPPPRYPQGPGPEWVNEEDFCEDDKKDLFGVWVRDPRWYAGECALRDYWGGPGAGVWSGGDGGGF